MSALPRMLVASEGDRTVVVLPVARHCSCGRMALMMVNRGGRTRCVTCDLLFREFNESPADEAVLAESVVSRWKFASDPGTSGSIPGYRTALMLDVPVFHQWSFGATRAQIAAELAAVAVSELTPQHRQLQRLANIIANVMSYIESVGPLPAPGADPLLGVERIHKEQKIFEVGRVVKLDGKTREALAAGARSGETWKLLEKFMVRGHWRNQAFGEGRALRRRQWIAPYYKGPEDLVEAVNRTYEVIS